MTTDGHRFAPDAVAAGAAALITERRLDLGVPEVVVADAREAMAPLASRLFGEPSRSLRVAAVTGTNGKTTTAFLLRSILEASGVRCGLLGTVKQVVGGVTEEVERTTPEAIDLQRTLRRMLEGEDQACAVEISSHALVLGRADCTRFAAAAFTNLTQDHLDFHADMDDYYAAKRLLFFPDPARREPPAVAVVNVDDPAGRELAAELARAGRSATTFSAAGGRCHVASARGRVRWLGLALLAALYRRGTLAVSLPLPGDFNVANALAAIGLAAGLGVGIKAAATALADAEAVPGRMEPIVAGQPFGVVVDYAHTPDSLDNVLAAARRLTAGRLISVFGCGGDRDRTKAPADGTLRRPALRRGDRHPPTTRAHEDPDAIIADVLAGISVGATGAEGLSDGRRDGVIVEPDRRAAIARAIGLAEAGDLVVIAGKGHEQGQEFEGRAQDPLRRSRRGRARSWRCSPPAREPPSGDRAQPRADRGAGRRGDPRGRPA